ncbi:RNA polymerase sigma factor SigJ [Chitinophaga varians]|uniref:RNA polymerase sigma factor SigJ n=1 Tax=Chitinophaga varians TaxID=2202339 RepID=UPI00165F909C|nr:RNA polymerase sigma factor SigJ [Chitinophaga varians]MBC9911141.1 RNA polymerase sigma factor SigJ [Chitinophaga varians]
MTQDPFLTHRSLLFTVAYEMLGSAADAEDVVQETWLRWSAVDPLQVHDPRAYLVRIVTRLSLNHMRTLSRRREEYVGQWLPEPLLTSADMGKDPDLMQHVSMAMLIVLETLGPTERAVFILHDVFGMPHGEISEVIGKSASAVRQIAHRARQHVAARQSRKHVTQAEQQAVVERFLSALQTGQLQQLMEVLAPDVVLTADGGGLVPAAKLPVHGAALIASLLVQPNRQVSATCVWLNGEPGGRIEINGTTAAVGFTIENGLITQIYAVANPEKLTRLDQPVELTR